MAGKQKIETKQILTPVFTLYHPDLVQPSKYNKDKYRIVAVFDKDTDLSALKQEMRRVAMAKWGSDVPKDLYLPLKSRDKMKKPEFYPEGSLNCAFLTKFKLEDIDCLLDRSGKKHLKSEDFYFGCKARAIIVCWPYDATGDNPPGITVVLQLLQFVEDGSRINLVEAKSLLDENPLPKQEPGAPELGTDAPADDDPFAF